MRFAFLIPLVTIIGCSNPAKTVQDQPNSQKTGQDTAANTYQQNYDVTNVRAQESTPNDTTEGIEITAPDGTVTRVAKTAGAANIQVFTANAASGSVAPEIAGTSQAPSNTGSSSATQDIRTALQLQLMLQQALMGSQSGTPASGGVEGQGTATSTTTTDQKLDRLIELLQNEKAPATTQPSGE